MPRYLGRLGGVRGLGTLKELGLVWREFYGLNWRSKAGMGFFLRVSLIEARVWRAEGMDGGGLGFFHCSRAITVLLCAMLHVSANGGYWRSDARRKPLLRYQIVSESP